MLNKLIGLLVILSAANAFAGIEGIVNFAPVTSPFIPYLPYGNVSSVEDLQANLHSRQVQLQAQLADVSRQLNLIDKFISAQNALNLKWVNSVNGTAPVKALRVSINNGPILFLCRAQFMHGTHPGIVTSSGCLITYGGYSMIRQNYDVLQGNTLTQWVSVNSISNYQDLTNADDSIWNNKTIPIQGGFENGKPLYFCKVSYNNQNYIGKTIGDICDFAFGGKEISLRGYQVLFGFKA